MKTVMRIILALLFAMWCVASTAQPPASPPSIGAGANQTAKPEAQQTQNTELAVAKAELEVTRQYQQHFLATVYWSLGILAAVAALLVSYSWWNNSRNYDRDRITFEREASAKLAEMIAKVADEQRSALQSITQRLEQDLTKQAKESEEKLLNQLSGKLNESKTEVSSQIAKLTKSLNSTQTEVKHLRLAAQLQTHAKTSAEGPFRNALQDSVSALEIALDMDDEYEIGNVLDLVSKDITQILSGRDLPIDNFLIGQLIDVLGRVRGTHAHAAAALKAKAPQMLHV